VAQVTDRTGFIAEADSEAEASVRTDATWQCAPEPGDQPWPEGVTALRAVGTYFVVGPGERLDAARCGFPFGLGRSGRKARRPLSSFPSRALGSPPSWIDSFQTLLDTTRRARWGASCPRQGSLLPPTFVSG